ncbi:MAG: class I SAM-dependent methyltransferase [Candidatus Peregrinibacteria bacterium]
MNEKTANELLKKVAEDYKKLSDEFDTTRKYDWKEFEFFLPYIKNNDFLVDLGCGNGRFFQFIHKHKKIKYLGIDNNPPFIKKAQKTYKNATFIEGDMLNIPVEDKKADIVISIAALHHIPSKKLRAATIEEMHRILRKNSTLMLTVWNLFQPKYKKYIWKSRLKHILSLGKYDSRDTFIPWGKSGIKRYYYAFKEKELKNLLEKKFKIIKEIKGNNLVFICRKK